jgi:hypothetical protein
MKPLTVLLLLLLLFSSCANEQTDTRSSTDTHELKSDTSDTQATKPVSTNPATALPEVYYWNYDTNTGIEKARVMSHDEAWEIMETLPATDGNFFGLRRGDDIVQFIYDDNLGLLLDIPNTDSGGYEKVVSMDECEKIISDVFAGKSGDDVALAY